MKAIRYPLNLQFFAQEKTEQATPRKLQDAREKGQVARSQELPSSIILLFVVLALWLFGGFFTRHLSEMIQRSFSEYALWQLTIQTTDMLFKQLVWEAFKLLLPIFLITVIAGLASNLAQIGFLFTTEPLQLKIEKLNPIEGAKRILSLRSIVELFKSIFKILITSSVAIYILWGARDQFLALPQKGVGHSAQFLGMTIIKLGVTIALLLFVLAILDFMYQRYDHAKRLRMSKQEIKDEYKKAEGDPLIKSKIKEKQRQMSMSRMMNEVLKADVVITNPTHYAVAIAYKADEMSAPTIVAKGKGFVALKLKETARENGIITMENKPLARALYAHAEIGDQVPEDLYKAVAEVLAYVYRLQGKV
ncbi:flagellar biosynthesis protein FlhB [Ammoniphilus oxalaticus]|uniref:Flagellar biosynthetic protein FlhB n=1 Tax=Ammoniphilus oxalaticus TaxID=66863 RepID=A0A419SJU9_9BACL|nr:flagellar biosynthesis protein FlhB [Ammoniphilus oxalaticus]RKD24209.1 flagellar biosynthesis protein FlhB [Ammoniphilus oxalaticus]